MDLKKRRMALGLSQEETARFLGVGISTWMRWEKGVLDAPRGHYKERLKAFESGMYDGYARMLLNLFPDERGLVGIPLELCEALLPVCRVLKHLPEDSRTKMKNALGDLQSKSRLVYIADVLQERYFQNP